MPCDRDRQPKKTEPSQRLLAVELRAQPAEIPFDAIERGPAVVEKVGQRRVDEEFFQGVALVSDRCEEGHDRTGRRAAEAGGLDAFVNRSVDTTGEHGAFGAATGEDDVRFHGGGKSGLMRTATPIKLPGRVVDGRAYFQPESPNF